MAVKCDSIKVFAYMSFSMLEDRSIQHLISWSNNNESFVMSPSSDFSKVLAYVVYSKTKTTFNLS